MAKRISLHDYDGTYYDFMRPNYDRCPDFYFDGTHDIWEGRKPHHINSLGCAEYRVWFGDARFYPDGRIAVASVNLSPNVNVFIIDENRLKIYDIRYSGKSVSFAYHIKDGKRLELGHSELALEDERIDSMLREKNIDCPVWVKVCRCAKRLWLEEIASREHRYQYIPTYND